MQGSKMTDPIQYLKIFFIFVIGIIIGRLTMAVQYALMKPTKKEVKPIMNPQKVLAQRAQVKKQDISKAPNQFITPKYYISIRKPLNSIDLNNKF